MFQTIFAVAMLVAAAAAHDDELSPARRAVLRVRSPSRSAKRAAEEVNVSAVVLAPSTTEGPYFATINDFAVDANLTAAAVATNRREVIDGVPLRLTINVYDVVGTIGTELANATVFLWHCDTVGVYGAVSLSSNPSNKVDTLGQKWLRSQQTTNANGTVVFDTVVPGWYGGRTLHFHLRVRLPSAASDTTFVITSQLFFQDAVQTQLKTRAPYSTSTTAYTTLASDNIASQAAASVGSALVLNLAGDLSTGFTSQFALGVDRLATQAPGGGMMGPGGPMPPRSTAAIATTVAETTAAATTVAETTTAALTNATTVAESTNATSADSAATSTANATDATTAGAASTTVAAVSMFAAIAATALAAF